MADSVTQPGANKVEAPAITQQDNEQTHPAVEATPAPTAAASPTVLWTPSFIVIFTLTLALGLSAECLLTLGWLNHFYPGPWISLGHAAFILGFFIAIIVISRSWWVRSGSIFGCIWCIFFSTNLAFSFFHLDPMSPIPAYLNATISSAMLGAYICLSLDRTPLTRWDAWFFRIAPILIIGVNSIIFFITPAGSRTISSLESAIAAFELVFSILAWWLRPSCWKTQPGPTFLFGMTPAIFLLLSLTSLGKGGNNFFLSQVALLSLLLAAMRVLQSERRRRRLQ